MEEGADDVCQKVHMDLPQPVEELMECQAELWTDRCALVTEWAEWVTRDENALTVQMLFFMGGFFLLYICMTFCPICVFGVLAFSIITCLQYRLMNLLLWACIFALWSRGWSFTNGSLSLTWG